MKQHQIPENCSENEKFIMSMSFYPKVTGEVYTIEGNGVFILDAREAKNPKTYTLGARNELLKRNCEVINITHLGNDFYSFSYKRLERVI